MRGAMLVEVFCRHLILGNCDQDPKETVDIHLLACIRAVCDTKVQHVSMGYFLASPPCYLLELSYSGLTPNAMSLE
jgi:hypothetical protein